MSPLPSRGVPGSRELRDMGRGGKAGRCPGKLSLLSDTIRKKKNKQKNRNKREIIYSFSFSSFFFLDFFLPQNNRKSKPKKKMKKVKENKRKSWLIRGARGLEFSCRGEIKKKKKEKKNLSSKKINRKDCTRCWGS